VPCTEMQVPSVIVLNMPVSSSIRRSGSNYIVKNPSQFTNKTIKNGEFPLKVAASSE
jgi:hypothetical protein